MTGTIILYGSILLFKRSINGVKPTDYCVINYLTYLLDHSSRPGNIVPLYYLYSQPRPDPFDSSNFDDQETIHSTKL